MPEEVRTSSAAESVALSCATSPCGSVAVTTTAEGLPVGLRIAQSQMSAAPEVLAARIVALCRLAAMSAGARRRAALAADGVSAEVLDALRLPDRAALLRAEDEADLLFAEAVPR
ncbi:MAG: hypothetical protein QM658_14805 [Gordonia sp. (in: high G+C Gram-positive bacteria)]